MTTDPRWATELRRTLLHEFSGGDGVNFVLVVDPRDPRRRILNLDFVKAREQGKGHGSLFMRRLAELADVDGVLLTLTPDTAHGATSVTRLEKFYRRFGFVPNKGRRKDSTLSMYTGMYRLPR